MYTQITHFLTNVFHKIFIIPQIAPTQTRGVWTGLNAAINQLAIALHPISLTAIYTFFLSAESDPLTRASFATAELASPFSCASASPFSTS